jgi:hypothetical protein
MFLEELKPVFNELTQQPIAFWGGFFSGVLRLKVSDDPLKSWLEKQGVKTYNYSTDNRDNGNGPQSISIE